MRNLEEKPGCNYSYYWVYNEVENLVRLRKVKKKKGKEKSGGDIFPAMEPSNAEEVETSTSTDEGTKNFLKSFFLEALKLGDDEILLAVAFITAEG